MMTERSEYAVRPRASDQLLLRVLYMIYSLVHDLGPEDRIHHDQPLRAAARAIYDACYPSEEWSPVGFEEAERFSTVHYRQAVYAAQQARCMLAGGGEQLALFAASAG